MPTSEFFLVDAPIAGGDGDCPPPPPSAKRVSKLSHRVHSAWVVRQRQMSAAPAGSSVVAAVQAERKKARADVLASCAAQLGKTPTPSLRESPPRASKTAAIAHIASQSRRPSPDERPGFVPVATVVDNAGDAASFAVAAAVLPGGSPSTSASGSSVSEDLLMGAGALKRGGGFADSSDYPSSDLDVPTDAEVSRYTFHERLAHYMEGERISQMNRKAVELVLLIEAGSYVRGLNPMRKPAMGDMILKKYQRLIQDIDPVHFVCESVRVDMLAGYKGSKKNMTGETLWRKYEREMTEVKTFASKFPGINCPSELPSGSTQLLDMKRPYIIKLWSERYPVTKC